MGVRFSQGGLYKANVLISQLVLLKSWTKYLFEGFNSVLDRAKSFLFSFFIAVISKGFSIVLAEFTCSLRFGIG